MKERKREKKAEARKKLWQKNVYEAEKIKNKRERKKETDREEWAAK